MDFVRNIWYVAMWSQDLKPGEIVGRTLLNEQLVLFRTEQGQVAALSDLCPHRFAPLHMGTMVDGCKVRCAYHGLEFDHTGACVKNPHGRQIIPNAARVQKYPTVEKHSLIWIWMGEAEADPATIPDFSMLGENSGFEVSKRDWLKMDASYDLVVDNLMDLSHTAYLHEGILGNEQTVQSASKLSQDDKWIKVTRQASDVPIPGFFDLMYKRNGSNVDYWADISWTAPGCLINDTGVTDPGKPRSEGTGIFGMHFLTPETDTTCWYHFAAVRQNPIVWGEPVDTEIREKIADLRRYAFEQQDQVMIRAQQRAIVNARRPLTPVSLETDAGLERYKRVMARLLAAEAAEAAEAERRGAPAAAIPIKAAS